MGHKIFCVLETSLVLDTLGPSFVIKFTLVILISVYMPIMFAIEILQNNSVTTSNNLLHFLINDPLLLMFSKTQTILVSIPRFSYIYPLPLV